MKQPFSKAELAELKRLEPYYRDDHASACVLIRVAPRLLEAAEEASRSPSTTVVVDLLARLDKAKAMIDRLLAIPAVQFDDPFLAEELAELRAELDR